MMRAAYQKVFGGGPFGFQNRKTFCFAASSSTRLLRRYVPALLHNDAEKKGEPQKTSKKRSGVRRLDLNLAICWPHVKTQNVLIINPVSVSNPN
jgi:hypothetical protein